VITVVPAAPSAQTPTVEAEAAACVVDVNVIERAEQLATEPAAVAPDANESKPGPEVIAAVTAVPTMATLLASFSATPIVATGVSAAVFA